MDVEGGASPARRQPARLDDTELDLWKALIRVSQLLPRALDEDLAARSSSLAHYEILAVLSGYPKGLRMTDLGHFALVSKPRLSVHVRELEGQGYAIRSSAPDDGRSTIVTITAAGRRALRQQSPTHLRLARRVVLDRVPPEDHATVLRALTAILAALGDPWRPGAAATSPP